MLFTRIHPGRVWAPRHAAILLEPLESRQLMSVSLNSAGWTVVTPSSDTRTIYVSSSSGNDANIGTSPTAAVKSLAKAASLLRDGSPDWMLLKRGDTWSGSSFPTWNKSGRSSAEPMYIGTFGAGSRPLIDTGAVGGFAATTGRAVNNLVMSGVQFYADQRDPNSRTF